jgi:hypothetical protein
MEKKCFGPKLEPNGQITVKIVLYGQRIIKQNVFALNCTRIMVQNRNSGQGSQSMAYLNKPDAPPT